jgi:hypothetical protein
MFHCGQKYFSSYRIHYSVKSGVDELLKAGLLNCPFMTFSMTPAMNALSPRQYLQNH